MKCLADGTKTCSNPKCGQSNPQSLENFVRSRHESDGRYHRCKSCRKRYLEDNKDKLKAASDIYGKKYRADGENKKKATRRASEHYAANRQKRLQTQQSFHRIRKELTHKIAIHYGCQNPDCKWGGAFTGSQLDYHHLDPRLKSLEISRILRYPLKTLISEINKCVVLCANCHREHHAKALFLTEEMLCKVNELSEIIT